MELMVVISIIAILAGVITVSFTQVRQRSRDSRRRSDLDVYTSALNQYHAINGTFRVMGKLLSGTVVTVGADVLNTGSVGQGFGLLNFANGTTAGNIHYPTSLSISAALLQGGYLTKPAADPFNNTFPNTTPASGTDQPDYALVLCSSNGDQATTGSADGFALWAKMERPLSTFDTANTVHYCGGSWTTRSATLTGFVMGYSAPPNASKDPIVGPDPVNKGADSDHSFEALQYYYAIGNTKY